MYRLPRITGRKISGIAAASALLLVAACGNNEGDGGGEAGGETYEWRLGFNTPEESVRGIAAERFKEVVEEESDGQITVEIYPAEALGSEQEMLDGIRSGSLDLQMAGGGGMQNAVPEYGILPMPFMVESFDEAYAVLDGPIGESWMEASREEGYHVLSHHDLGFAQITNNVHPIQTPDDLQGVTMRSTEEPTSIETFSALGSGVSTMPFTEVYPALQQGVVDGQFNPLDAIFESNFDEVQDYVSLVNIFYYHVNFIMNPDLWDGLDPDLQEIVQQAADAAQDVSREQTQQNDEEMRGMLDDAFEEVEVEEDVDTDAFREAVEPAFEEFEQFAAPEDIAEVQEFLEDYRSEQ